jgi:trehalose 6-phosphate phosphatase
VSQAALQHLGAIGSWAGAAGELLLLLDFDGTLSPIVEHPDKAWLPTETRALLAELQERPGVTLSVVSGRALDDLRRRIELDVIYAGNHGLEISGRGLHFREPQAEALRAPLAALCRVLETELQSIPGILVENKGLTASVHYRNVALEQQPAVADGAARAIADDSRFELRTGRMIVEIRPRVDWDKGSAAAWIRAQLGRPAAVFCAGDDRTDEDLFRCVPDGVSVKVGFAGATAARFHVSDPAELNLVLRTVADAVAGRG